MEYIELALAIVGGASLIVKGFEAIAKITPSAKDDEYAATAVRWVGMALSVLEKLALNPKK